MAAHDDTVVVLALEDRMVLHLMHYSDEEGRMQSSFHGVAYMMPRIYPNQAWVLCYRGWLDKDYRTHKAAMQIVHVGEATLTVLNVLGQPEILAFSNNQVLITGYQDGLSRINIDDLRMMRVVADTRGRDKKTIFTVHMPAHGASAPKE